MFRKIINWENRILVDGVSAFSEALIVLLLSSLSLIILGINYGLSTDNVGVFEAFYIPVTSTLHPTEMITYVTGILSSTTAYFLVRISVLKLHSLRVFPILIATFVLFWVATPFFIAGLETTPKNQEFTMFLTSFLAISTLTLWLYSLFTQRRIFEKSVTISGDSRGNEIAKNVEGS